ncbi:MAG: ABC transporter substrate-binding protein [Actinomycetota bacterium]|nr:ABC transporter substrate-binding protein [Actinomycetota bacterium]
MAGDDATWCDTVKKDWPGISGKTISIYSGITGVEGTQLENSWKDFATCTGANIKYNSDKNFEQQIVVQAQSGSVPDIAFVPQPGLLKTLVATGKVQAAPTQVAANVDKYWDKGWRTYGTIDGKFYAAPLGANVKSLVWYSPKAFKTAGYTVPTTWDDMIKLSDKIVAAGNKPWCAGVQSGVATGWTATDWLEEVVLRQAGPAVYDQWVAHKIKFSDPQIADALKTVGSIWKNDKYVNAGIGDVSSIATTPFADGGLPLQTGKCSLHQQASFYATNFKNNPNISENGDIFAFYEPTMSDKFGKPVEVGGEFTAAFANRPEVQAFQYYLSTAHWANNQSKAAISRISANKGLDSANVKDPINKLSVQILQDPKTVSRFDASDLMPAAVGSGAEWKQLTAWITGQDDQTTLAAIDAAWPSS